MVRNGHGGRAGISSPLHHDVTATLSDHLESVSFEDAADVFPGENTELTHAPLQSG
jgi:hypothetical protein